MSVRTTAGRPTGAVLGLYALVQGLNVGLIIFGPRWLTYVGSVATGLLAVAALVVGIHRFRPVPRRAWWLITAGIAVAALSSVGLMISNDADGPFGLLLTSDILRLLRYVLLGAGLVVLSRAPYRRAGLANMLDAGIAAAGLFLLLWTVVIAPSLTMGTRQPQAFLIITPAVALIVFAISVKLVFTVGIPTPAMLLLFVGAQGLLWGPIALMLVGREGQDLLPRLIVWGGIAVIGAAGLHPSLRRAAGTPVQPKVGPSRRRVAMFALLAVLCPYAWLVEIWGRPALRDDPRSYLVPITASAILILLLVARLSMMATVAEERADDLAEQASRLSEAIQEQETLQHQLTYRALHDPLTGLANRVVLAERMEWTLSQRGSRHNALILLDLDAFKEVNDTYGHPTGDAVLVEVARRLVDSTQGQGILARLGGDEFAIFLDDVDPGMVQDWAENLRRAIAEPFRSNGHELVLTTSVGLYLTSPQHPVSPSTALSYADLALYAAKDGGRDRVMVFQPHLRRARLDRTRMSTDLRRALVDDELSMEYQPIVSLPTERVTAVEALLRWTRGDGRRTPPAAFIPVAEEAGMINIIGAWVLRQACADAARWYRGHGVSVSVNVSGRQLDDPGFADQVVDLLAECDLPGAALILELTETTLVSLSSTATVVSQLRTLRQHGVRIAVDDFGTGYSSLAYLSRLPVDIIKLDRSFMHDSRPDPGPDGWEFVGAILQLVDSVGLQTIAEGVETRHQVDALRELGCPLAQGYVFSRPVPAGAIERMLAVPAASRSASGLGRL